MIKEAPASVPLDFQDFRNKETGPRFPEKTLIIHTSYGPGETVYRNVVRTTDLKLNEKKLLRICICRIGLIKNRSTICIILLVIFCIK